MRDENGILQASIDTDHAAVRKWADNTFSQHWEAATPLDPSELCMGLSPAHTYQRTPYSETNLRVTNTRGRQSQLCTSPNDIYE